MNNRRFGEAANEWHVHLHLARSLGPASKVARANTRTHVGKFVWPAASGSTKLALVAQSGLGSPRVGAASAGGSGRCLDAPGSRVCAYCCW